MQVNDILSIKTYFEHTLNNYSCLQTWISPNLPLETESAPVTCNSVTLFYLPLPGPAPNKSVFERLVKSYYTL